MTQGCPSLIRGVVVSPRLLLLDIETSPSIVYTFDMFQTNISSEKVIEPSTVLCWAAKWYGEKKVFYRSVFHHTKEDVMQGAHDLLAEADILIHYNGRKFDIPHLNREFLLSGLTPPAPAKQIDLYQAIKRQFNFTHNGLGYVCRQLGLATKMPNEGIELWIKCMHGDKDAWATMRAYNIHDVEIMEPLYKRLLPWIPSHPSIAALVGERVCPGCGSDNLVPRRSCVTTVSRFPMLFCLDCGKWNRETKRVSGTTVTAVTG